MITAYTLHQILNINEFSEWLRDHNLPEPQVVGITREDSTCPIANFLTEKLKDCGDDEIGNVFITGSTIGVNRKNGLTHYVKTDPPHWVSEFVEKVDEVPDLFPVYPPIEFDENDEPYNDNPDPLEQIPVKSNICLQIMYDIIAETEEAQCESQATMEKEYSLNV